MRFIFVKSLLSMSKAKKPDQIVFNEETQRYDAALKPYTRARV